MASVVVTTYNEAVRLPHLLDSLEGQDAQVIVVDAGSPDDTAVVAREHPIGATVIEQPCTRGEGRNLGADVASDDLLCFIDADCIANNRWVRSLVEANGGDSKRVVAGNTQYLGFWAFTRLHRVELPHQGQDTTWPSCNLAYPTDLFRSLGGFDPTFITAEDIDLNYRAVESGATIYYEPEAIVYAHARDSVRGFLKQAYWNGYGRKQLTAKHGGLWHEYSFRDMLRLQGADPWGLLRMGAGATGYMRAKLTRRT